MTTAREVSDRYTVAINAHDAAAIGALYAEGAGLKEPAGEFMGREAVVQYWERFFEAFPDLSVRDTFKAENGDTAINEWTASGTNSGPMETPEGTIPATGRPVTIVGCDLLTVSEGLITEHRAHYDQLGFMSQLGLASEPAAVS
jgi:predicted ester cyclase